MRFVLVSFAVLATACGAASHPPTATGWLSLEHRSSMDGTFTLVTIRASLDGQPIATIDHEVATDATAEPSGITTPICLAHVPISRGTHQLEVELTYAGHGYGVFAYVRGYRFRVHDTRTIEVSADAPGIVVTTTGYERADVTPEDRPRIQWSVVPTADEHAGCVPPDP
jgi:hypothetical protein